MTPRSENPREEGPWGWQARDAAAQAGQLGTNHYAVYCALTHFQSAAATDHKRRFAASYDQLAEYLQCSTKTVQRCLADLQKAGLVRIFSGANGSRRNIRNAFFLASISRDCESQRRDCESTLPKDCESLPPKDCESYLNKNKEQLDRAAASGSGSNKERRREPARPPLRGGSGPKEPSDENAPWLGEATPETTERFLRMKAALEAINAQ
jgi:biotin operon repressor